MTKAQNHLRIGFVAMLMFMSTFAHADPATGGGGGLKPLLPTPHSVSVKG